MSYATPTRAPASVSELASPSPSFSRRASAVSSVGGGASPSVAASERKRRTRLRDYYGLGAAKAGDTADLDAPDAFNADSYFQNLASTASLPDLLKREIELLNEIRELDGERQSLVYNHHHELIDASDTIRKMKSRAEALDSSLDSLKTSFQSISQLSASLAPPASSTSCSPPRPATSPRSPETPQTPSRRHLSTLPESPDSPSLEATPTQSRKRSASTATTVPTSASAPAPSPAAPFRPLVHLPALLSLPILLRSLLSTPGEKARADALWGTWEPALRSWEDAGVEGAREIGMECRDVLRTSRRASVSERREA
ncbi:hypothetical protein Rhopal_005177-T1 [Rhodotorula paludigena]|uniref:Vacuolar protein sorting-associated protein 51 homolog n=1 Tax=Rhodotorula paludigena TaxID=86838 RepID=A0AAV5GRP0_9BASI|nr:hypothetical protein Rhopal_005177-T1 [Rhodotorula paludigena]